MGFTRYWERPAILSSRKFTGASSDCQKAVEHLARKHAVGLRYEYDSTLPAVFDNDQIQFNGLGQEGRDTFGVDREFRPMSPKEIPTVTGLWFDYCKTDRRPYDVAVFICLIVLRQYFGEQFVISSDGNDDAEESLCLARHVCQQILGYGADFSLLTTAFERFPFQGLPYQPEMDDPEGKDYRFSNGWLMVPWSAEASVYRPSAQQKLVASEINMTRARWASTIAYLENLLLKFAKGDTAVSIASFMEDARGTLHNWTPLAVLADALEDGNDRRYRILRALLPRHF